MRDLTLGGEIFQLEEVSLSPTFLVTHEDTNRTRIP